MHINYKYFILFDKYYNVPSCTQMAASDFANKNINNIPDTHLYNIIMHNTIILCTCSGKSHAIIIIFLFILTSIKLLNRFIRCTRENKIRTCYYTEELYYVNCVSFVFVGDSYNTG